MLFLVDSLAWFVGCSCSCLLVLVLWCSTYTAWIHRVHPSLWCFLVHVGVVYQFPPLTTVFVNMQERKPELSSEIMAFRDYLLSSTISDTLDVWELKGIYHDCWWKVYDLGFKFLSLLVMKIIWFGLIILNIWNLPNDDFLTDLGHQTAQRIVHASDPLQSMQEINQNFPSVVSSLSRMKVNHPTKMLQVLNDLKRCLLKHGKFVPRISNAFRHPD